MEEKTDLSSQFLPKDSDEEMTSDTSNYRQPTMAEVLSSIPGFNLRVPSRKRSNKKMSAAAQIEETRKGYIDLESQDSILVETDLRKLLNRDTFESLPQLYQQKLLQLLPHVDRVPTQTETMYRLSSSGLDNEYFAKACLAWRERLAEGEFTPEYQAKLKEEQEKEKKPPKPVRTVGAATRAVTSYRKKKAAQESTLKSYSTSSPGFKVV